MVLQHRLVMECFLGRFLSGIEAVHHLNGNKQDNRIENLELLESQSAHMIREHQKRSHLHNPSTVELVRKAASDPKSRISDLPISHATVWRICKKYDIQWVAADEVRLDRAEALKVLQVNTRAESVKILGVNLQTLWNKFPEEMRMTATRKLLKWGVSRDESVIQKESSPRRKV